MFGNFLVDSCESTGFGELPQSCVIDIEGFTVSLVGLAEIKNFVCDVCWGENFPQPLCCPFLPLFHSVYQKLPPKQFPHSAAAKHVFELGLWCLSIQGVFRIL